MMAGIMIDRLYGVLDNSIVIIAILNIISNWEGRSYYVYALLQFACWHQP